MTVLESRVAKKLEAVISGATPGVQVQVHQAGRKVFDIAVGETYPYYDLASVTKIVFTTLFFMRAYEMSLWSTQSRVSEFVPEFPNKETKLTQCLNHSTGLTWWKPFYQTLITLPDLQQKWQYLGHQLCSEPPVTEAEKRPSEYSDLGFLLLALVMEKMAEKPLFEIWRQLRDEFYSATTFEFHYKNIPKYESRLYAPTEEREWRKKVIQGEVNDDNTWVLDGVSSHAGLFGSIDDLGWYALLLRALLHGVAKTSIKQRTARLFMSKSRPEGLGDFALGFMMPAKSGSLVGKHFSPQSIGHWGFTGTSVWYDPVHDLSVVILSNRTWLGRDNKKFNDIRPELHNWIIEGLRRV